MSGSGSARSLIVAALVVLAVAGCGGTAALVPSSTPSAPSVAIPATTARPDAPTTTPSRPTTYDTSDYGPSFDLPLTVELPEGWTALTPAYSAPRTLGLIHGDLDGDDSEWWGFGFALVDGATVMDPADADEPAALSDAKLPWPDSYLDYLAALPDVVVEVEPEPIAVGGVDGRQIIVATPPMHPTIFLKDDTAWLGGGREGIDPAFRRKVIELTVDGRKVLIEYVDLPGAFDGHLPQVDAVIESVAFGG